MCIFPIDYHFFDIVMLSLGVSIIQSVGHRLEHLCQHCPSESTLLLQLRHLVGNQRLEISNCVITTGVLNLEHDAQQFHFHNSVISFCYPFFCISFYLSDLFSGNGSIVPMA